MTDLLRQIELDRQEQVEKFDKRMTYRQERIDWVRREIRTPAMRLFVDYEDPNAHVVVRMVADNVPPRKD